MRYKILIAKLIKRWRVSLWTGVDSSPPEVLYQGWMSWIQFHYFLWRLLDLIQNHLEKLHVLYFISGVSMVPFDFNTCGKNQSHFPSLKYEGIPWHVRGMNGEMWKTKPKKKHITYLRKEMSDSPIVAVNLSLEHTTSSAVFIQHLAQKEASL